MLKRKNRKGFTLAELLIVVAIIAVLVAIAVPLFVGSLNKAKGARDNANIRAVRGAAVVYLLENSEGDVWYSDGSPRTKLAAEWDVTATIGSNGEIQSLDLQAKESTKATFDEAGKVTENGGTFTVTLKLVKTQIGQLKPLEGD